MTTETPAPPAAALGLPGAARGGALEGVVVVELAETLAGVFAGGLLADLGATVIKVEPAGGSPLRRLGPGIPGESSSLYFQSENRGKYSVRAELADLAGGGWLARLLASADALVEDLGPGRLEAAGLSPERCTRAIHGWPSCASRRSARPAPSPGSAVTIASRRPSPACSSRRASPTDRRSPSRCRCSTAGRASSAANGLLMAIFHARRSGRGTGRRHRALPGRRCACRRRSSSSITGPAPWPRAWAPSRPPWCPPMSIPTRDGGWIAVSGAGDQPFVRLCEAVEAPDAPKDPRFATPAARLEHRAESDALVASWIARHDLAEVEARFFACGVAGTAIRSVDEIMADEHVRARGDLLSLSSETGREFIAPAPVPKLSRTPARNPVAAPRLGEHTDAVRAALAAIAARPRVEVIAARRRPAPRPVPADRRVRSAGSASSTSPSGSRARWPRPSWPSSAPTSSWWSCPCPRRRRSARPARRPFASPTATSAASRSTCGRREGRAVFLDLVRVSDVIVENFRPGTLERWDLAPATLLEINPRLVLLRASGFGQTGPYAARAAFNPVGLAFGGATYLNGWPDRPPLRDGVTAGDYSTALFNVLGHARRAASPRRGRAAGRWSTRPCSRPCCA